MWQAKDLISIDFETFYDISSGYSLRSMTPEEYIRDPRFEVLMCAIRIGLDDPYVVVGHNQVGEHLRSLGLNSKPVAAHNMNFDGFILKETYGIEAGDYICTMQMARILHGSQISVSLRNLAEVYQLPSKGSYIGDMDGKRLADFGLGELEEAVKYATRDVELVPLLYTHLLPEFQEQSLLTLSDTIRACVIPQVVVDVELLEEYVLDKRIELQNRISDWVVHLNTTETAFKSMLSSNLKFKQLLESFGYTCPMKQSPTAKDADGNPKMIPALAKTDTGFQEMLNSPDEDLRTLCELRLNSKSTIGISRAESFIEIGKRGLMPIPLKAMGTITGRWSADSTYGLNFQNLPKRGGDKTLRRSLRAPDGMVWISVDLSQIELRKMMCAAGQEDVIEMLAGGMDVYSWFASKIYHKPVDKNTDDGMARMVGKVAMLSLQYYAGWRTFKTMANNQYGLHLSDEECEHIVNTYRREMNRVTRFWNMAGNAVDCLENGQDYEFGESTKFAVTVDNNIPCLILSDGYKIKYRDLQRRMTKLGRMAPMYYDPEKRTNKVLHSGILTSHCIQGNAGRLLGWHNTKLREQGIFFVISIHDEYGFLAPEDEWEEWYSIITDVMSTPAPWCSEVPVMCEGTVGYNYADLMSVEQFTGR